MSLQAKNCVCRSNGLACGQYKDKEEKTPKKTLKGPSSSSSYLTSSAWAFALRLNDM